MDVLTSNRPRRTERERGSASVEFALIVLPVFALLFFTINLGWILFAYASLQEGVREGVRFAVTGQLLPNYTSQDASIRKVVQTYSFGFIQPANALNQISIQYYAPPNLTAVSGFNSNVGGNVVKVSVTGIAIAPFAPIWLSKTPILLGVRSSDVVEPSPITGPPSR